MELIWFCLARAIIRKSSEWVKLQTALDQRRTTAVAGRIDPSYVNWISMKPQTAVQNPLSVGLDNN